MTKDYNIPAMSDRNSRIYKLSRAQKSATQKKLNFALQGGGIFGAYTWGVLDQFLSCRNLHVGSISGTSAGAFNAIAVADGLVRGSPKQARKNLHEIWQAVREIAFPLSKAFSPFKFMPGSNLIDLATNQTLLSFRKTLSPYQLNPIGHKFLKIALNDLFDFEAIRTCTRIKLYIAATDVSTGLARIFTNPELSADVVLASGCLPTLFPAIKIDDRYYWDGGFSSNPNLTEIIENSRIRDTLLVQLNPCLKEDVPTSTHDISAGINRITFAQPLIREVQYIEKIKRLSHGIADKDYRLARFHLIDGTDSFAPIKLNSNLIPEQGTLTKLFETGRGDADRWLKVNWSNIGKKSTTDLFQELVTNNDPKNKSAA